MSVIRPPLCLLLVQAFHLLAPAEACIGRGHGGKHGEFQMSVVCAYLCFLSMLTSAEACISRSAFDKRACVIVT